MKNGKKNKLPALLPYITFFLIVATIITIAMFIFGFISEASGGNIQIIALVMMLVILFLAFVCTVIDAFRRRTTIDRPVKKILDATNKIAAGDFSVRLHTDHIYQWYDQFDYIMENLNKMSEELSKMEVLRNDFISNVSHELKTPVAVIQNYAKSLQREDLSAETRKKYATTLVETTKKLNDLVVNILQLNKLENQKIHPEFQLISLDEELAQAVLRQEDLIEKKNLIINCDLDEVKIYSSASLLELVWNNLFSNAVKFTDEGGTIGVSLKKENDKAVVKISDTGCGISKDVGSHIFEKFYQGDTSHSREGNGLGLALVKKVIDVVGGEIRVESEIGKGSTFTVVLR